LEKKEEDYFYPTRNLFLPSHKFDFGNYFGDSLCKQEYQYGTDESGSKNSQDDDTAIQSSSDIQSPSKYSQNDILSCSGTSSNPYGDLHDLETSDKEVKSRRKASINMVPKVKNTKKINKKKQGKKKVRKSKRMSERLKNIVKNYGKNCATFAISELGHQFLLEVLTEEDIPKFKEFIRSKIPSITNIANFREMLLVSEVDDSDTGKFKKAFQYVSEIFIRDYSFNWIFHSPRINDVKGHIFARFKMLRRIRDPKHFTYIH